MFHLKDRSHCVCDLVVHTDQSQSLISHHLADLANAGFVKSKRKGKYLDYCLTDKGKKFLDAIFVILDKKGGDIKHERS